MTIADGLIRTQKLSGTIRIPGAAGDVTLEADLRGSSVTASIDVDAPREGRNTTRVNWLLRQLSEAHERIRVDAYAAGVRTSTSDLLGRLSDEPGLLIADPKRDLRSFRVSLLCPMGAKRGTGRGAFIDSVLDSIDELYETVVQNLRSWSARAPQLPPAGKTAVEAVGVDTTTVSHDDVAATAEEEPPSATPGESSADDQDIQDGSAIVEHAEWTGSLAGE